MNDFIDENTHVLDSSVVQRRHVCCVLTLSLKINLKARLKPAYYLTRIFFV